MNPEEQEETRQDLIAKAKSFGIPEALLEKLNITSLRKIVEYEEQVREIPSAAKEV